MAVNTSGSWMTAFASSRVAEIAGLTLDGTWPIGFGRGRTDHNVYQSGTGAFNAIRVIADDDDAAPSVVHHTNPVSTHPILEEDLFRSALVRERKRADRFDEVFAVVTVESLDPADALARELLKPIAGVITEATRETDLVGWLTKGKVIGVMLPELVAPAQGAASQIEDRIGHELAVRLGSTALSRVSVKVHVHAGAGVSSVDATTATEGLVAAIDARRSRTVPDGFKRALDIVFSLALLTILSPIFLILAAAVKLTSRGPVLFRQTRIGEKAQPFTMLKFRSMNAEAPAALHQQFVTEFIRSGAGAKGAGGVFKLTSDPRITAIGHILRKTSLDELPQFWNVLRGDMSLVGPRPPLQYELEQYRSWHWRRVLDAKPGITGLWQVKGRSRTTFDEMVRLDLRYVRTRSLWTDIRILLATPRAVLTGKGAC
jgi:lipopolysaccharide/colanic/teichoic acid biosynthesis glycosyltransferase